MARSCWWSTPPATAASLRNTKASKSSTRSTPQRGFTILGFPSGDFGGQEKGSNKEIAEFCYNTYGVKFPMFTKSSVKGSAANPLFAALTKDTGQAPKWNFHKYLIGRDGKVVASFPSQVEPLDKKLTGPIESLLAAQ